MSASDPRFILAQAKGLPPPSLSDLTAADAGIVTLQRFVSDPSMASAMALAMDTQVWRFCALAIALALSLWIIALVYRARLRYLGYSPIPLPPDYKLQTRATGNSPSDL
jgi:hypothetical protein